MFPRGSSHVILKVIQIKYFNCSFYQASRVFISKHFEFCIQKILKLCLKKIFRELYKFLLSFRSFYFPNFFTTFS